MCEKASSRTCPTFRHIPAQADLQKVPVVPAPWTANCPRAYLGTIPGAWKHHPYHRNTEQLRSESSSGVHPAQLSCSEQSHLKQVAQDHVQSGFGLLQGGTLSSLSEQPVPAFDHPHRRERFFSCVRGVSHVLVCAPGLLPSHWQH